MTQIDVVDLSDNLHTVWTGTDPSLPGQPVDFLATWLTSDFLVKGVKVTVDTNHNLSTWEEIDAVQLHGNVDPDAIAGYQETDLGDNHYYIIFVKTTKVTR